MMDNKLSNIGIHTVDMSTDDIKLIKTALASYKLILKTGWSPNQEFSGGELRHVNRLLGACNELIEYGGR